MGSRKEKLKKSLGITEYPWSSDDDEDVQPTQDVLRRSSGESRPSVADLPGTSGIQPQSEQSSPATSRRIQEKMDRDLFWSIINNTQKLHNTTTRRMSRTSDPISSSTRSAAQGPRAVAERISEPRPTRRNSERPTNSVDVQRVLAFKKLTRSLQNLAQIRAASNHSSQRLGSSANSTPRASRTSEYNRAPRVAGQLVPIRLFTPTINLNREGFTYRTSWRRPVLIDTNNTKTSRSNERTVENPVPPAVPVEVWHYPENEPQPSTSADSDAPSTSQIPQSYVNVDNSDEELLTEMQPVPPSVRETELRGEANENTETDNNEESPHIDTGSGARLIEEVVEVNLESTDETDTNNPPPPGADADDEVSPTLENNTSAGTGTSEENNTEAAQPASSYHGVKRKRASSDDLNESLSLHEFNQNLLRLLECPVCLEWMEPPISQCRRGHLVCGRCRARLAACPVCRTPFSSVRNRAMEGVAEMLRYPCRHGCGREVRLRKRHPHEASCGARLYHCPAPPCARHPPLPRDQLAQHFQCKHLPILKIGTKHKFSMKVNSEQHDTWLIMALNEYFHLRVDVDIRTWGVIVYVAFIGPKKKAKHFTYEVTVEGQHNSRRLVYTRGTHSDLESSSLNVSRQDCFHLTLDQALNFLRFKNRHCEPDKYLDFDVEITKWEPGDSESKEDSDS